MPPKVLAAYFFAITLVGLMLVGLVEAVKTMDPRFAFYLLLGFVIAWGLQECRKVDPEEAP